METGHGVLHHFWVQWLGIGRMGFFLWLGAYQITFYRFFRMGDMSFVILRVFSKSADFAWDCWHCFDDGGI